MRIFFISLFLLGIIGFLGGCSQEKEVIPSKKETFLIKNVSARPCDNRIVLIEIECEDGVKKFYYCTKVYDLTFNLGKLNVIESKKGYIMGVK